MTRMLITAALLTGAAGLAPVAFAQTSDWTGLYVGGGVGYSQKSDDGETVVFDTNRDGTPDTVFHVAMETAEAVRLNPASTGAQFDVQRGILQSITDTI